MVLKGNEGQVETGVPVEEEDHRQVHLVLSSGSGRGHLAVLELLCLVEVKLLVQAPPLLVVLVDPLSTDGQLDVRHGALGHPLAGRVSLASCREVV